MKTQMTVEQIRAEVDAAKKVADARFMSASGGRTAKQFVDDCLRPVIAGSHSPQSAMTEALKRAQR